MFLRWRQHSSRVGRSGKLWETPPSQSEDQTMPGTNRAMPPPRLSQPWRQVCHSSTPAPKQQMLTFENSKYYHKMIHSGIFFLVRSDTFPMASSSLRRGLPSRNPEEHGRRQTLSGLHMCHLPCRLLNNWFLIIFRHF